MGLYIYMIGVHSLNWAYTFFNERIQPMGFVFSLLQVGREGNNSQMGLYIYMIGVHSLNWAYTFVNESIQPLGFVFSLLQVEREGNNSQMGLYIYDWCSQP